MLHHLRLIWSFRIKLERKNELKKSNNILFVVLVFSPLLNTELSFYCAIIFKKIFLTSANNSPEGYHDQTHSCSTIHDMFT